MKKIVFGHKSPDTDSVCSAIVYSLAAKEQGKEVIPYRLGELNKETEYILKTLNVEAPMVLENISEDVEITLVDHNEAQQSIEGIKEANVVEVFDHHRLANFETKNPININIKPVGCTSTVLYLYFQEQNINVTKVMASLMLSAIISDTLLFKSPTSTPIDTKVAKELAKISGLNIESYGMDMLKAGTDLSEFSTKKLLQMDTKEFETRAGKYQVGQINTVDIAQIQDTRGEEIKDLLNEIVNDEQLDAFMFIITDIVNSTSIAYVVGENAPKIADNFKSTLNDNIIDLPGVVSRKKQVVPFL